ncbi:unnamed protein product [Prorocentrum cordatum]|uniref:Reverse transcriptase Ty1/copia-type domain-containing protein n=1 Tax=Prorocentrum cordatum TaxID=2364126 RepID=A0ABN9XUU8_9DINO|nr:unnamed protein product [Polarella glacialis]
MSCEPPFARSPTEWRLGASGIERINFKGHPLAPLMAVRRQELRREWPLQQERSWFDGKQESWSDWCFLFRSYVASQDERTIELMDRSTTMDEEVVMGISFNDEKAADHGVRTQARGRQGALLNQLLNTTFKAGVGHKEAVETWGREVTEYEEQAEDILPESIKANALVQGQEDEILKSHLTLNSNRLMRYKDIRKESMDYIVIPRVWHRDNDQVIPMDVDAVCSWHGKDGRDSKGKGKSAKGDEGPIYASMLAAAGASIFEDDDADYLMIDSGAGIITCPMQFAEAEPHGSSNWIVPKNLPPLEAATGQSIIHRGACAVNFMAAALGQQQEIFKMRFQIANVKCPIVAQQDLLEAGFVPKYGLYSSVLEAPSGRIFPLVQQGRIWHMKMKRVVTASEPAVVFAPLREPAVAQPIPVYRVWIDYSFPGMKGTDDVMTLLVCLDFGSSAIESANVMEKGAVDYGIKVLVQALQYWGRMRVVVSRDQENAITALARAAATARDEETVLQVGPRLDSKSKGPIQAAGGRVQQLIRALVHAVNAHHKVELKPSEPISSWLARHAGWILTRFTVREDGLTPYRRLKGRDCHGQIAEFAETAMHKLPPGAAGKMEARWGKGIWLGKANVSDEHMIGTPRGRVFARSIARRPDEKRWNHNLFIQIICTPFDPKATLLAQGAVNRPRYLTKGILNRMGRTPGCPACDETGQCHTAERRARLEALLGAEDIAKVGGLAVNVMPIELRVVDLGEYAAVPYEENDISNVTGALSGQLLPAEKVREGRARGRAKMKEHGVFKRAHVTEAKGKRVWGKWLQDWRVGTDTVRCRFVAMQDAYQARDDAFAGTPLLKFVRLALVLAATFGNRMKVYLIGLWNISNAFFHAEMGEDVYAVPPPGEEGPNVVWHLRKALYGTRRASKLFQRKVIGTLTDQGFIRMLVTVMVFYHVQKGIYTVVHGDDFMAVAKFEVKRSPFVGSAEAGGEATSGHFLKRTVSWTEKGFHWESDAKHARTVVEAHGKLPAAREISPASKSIGKEVPTALDKLGYAEKKLFQSAAPTALYWAADRPDIQFATSWIMRGMQEPLVLHELELKRLAAYSATHPQMMWNFEYQELPSEVTIVTDSDWAGDEVTRRSRGGGFEYVREARIDSWAGQQATRAPSS